MRYLIIPILALTLIACNLVTVSTPTPVPPPVMPTAAATNPVEQIAYWQSVPIDSVTVTDEDYVFFEQIVLRRVETATPELGELESNLSFAIGAMLASNQVWQGNDTVLESVTVEDDLATIRLNGQITAVGGAILSIVPTQVQLTIFEFDAINRAIITLNGETIYNMGIANDAQARPDDFIYTRDTLAESLSFAD